MESCLSVQRELDKVETKFTGLHDHYSNTIDDFISSIENIRRELAEGTAVDQNHHPFVAIFFLFTVQFVQSRDFFTSPLTTSDHFSEPPQSGSPVNRGYAMEPRWDIIFTCIS